MKIHHVVKTSRYHGYYKMSEGYVFNAARPLLLNPEGKTPSK
jgi:hypothetical protein